MLRIADAVIEILEPRSPADGIALRHDYFNGLNEHFLGDTGRIRQVLMSLMNNALKFTDRGQVSLEIRPPERRQEIATVRFVVVDSGIGVRPKELTDLSGSFTQHDICRVLRTLGVHGVKRGNRGGWLSGAQ